MAKSIPALPAKEQLAEIEAALAAPRSAKPLRGQIDLVRDVDRHLARLRRAHSQQEGANAGHAPGPRPKADA